MTLLKLFVGLAVGVSHSDKRGVAFLRGEPSLSAGTMFDASENTSAGKRIRHRMGLWIQSPEERQGKFHGFSRYDKKYRACFTFIDIDEKLRYYGFKCHPKPEDPRFELIVLTSCVVKKEDAVDVGELDRVLIWKNSMATQQALINAFPKKDSQK